MNLAILKRVFAKSGENIGTAFGLLFFSGFFIIWAFFMVVFLLGFIFWIWMLVDCVKRDFKNENEKLLWILILIFAHWIGALIYYFLVKRKKENSK